MIRNFFLKNKSPEPYRILFPLGILSAISAILFWVLFYKGLIKYYPKTAHASLFYFGFFYSFVSGFFMTAVPKMTGASVATWFETIFQAGLIVLQIFLALLNQLDIQVYVASFQVLFLMYFLLSRLLVAKKVPFAGFYFVPFAFFWALFGLLRFMTGYNLSIQDLFLFSGEAFLLNLICGLGSRLVPAISRMTGAITPDKGHSEVQLNFYISAVTLFNLGYVLYILNFHKWSDSVLLLVLFFIFVRGFRIFQFPTPMGALALGLKLAAFSMITSKILNLFEYGNRLANNHILHIGGLLMMTLLISTRVILAHGKRSLEYEIKSPLIITFISLISASAFGRFIMGNNLASSWFLVAIWFLIIAHLIWLYKFILSTYWISKNELV